MTALTVTDVSKSYRRAQERVTAMARASFSLRFGEVVAITGPSGSGKTSLLNIIAGFDRPDTGSIVIGDFDVTRAGDEQMDLMRTRTIGFIFQQFNLVPGLSAVENVEMALYRTTLERSVRRQLALDELARLGLGSEAFRRPSRLSGGQQQRVAVARAMVGRPALLLADEPTAALDKDAATNLLTLIMELTRKDGAAALISTHDPRCIDKADRVLTIVDGEIAL